MQQFTVQSCHMHRYDSICAHTSSTTTKHTCMHSMSTCLSTSTLSTETDCSHLIASQIFLRLNFSLNSDDGQFDCLSVSLVVAFHSLSLISCAHWQRTSDNLIYIQLYAFDVQNSGKNVMQTGEILWRTMSNNGTARRHMHTFRMAHS